MSIEHVFGIEPVGKHVYTTKLNDLFDPGSVNHDEVK